MCALGIGRVETLWQMDACGSPEGADGIENWFGRVFYAIFPGNAAPVPQNASFTSETGLGKVCVALDVTRPFNDGMSSDEILVYVNADTGFFKGSNIPLVVD